MMMETNACHRTLVALMTEASPVALPGNVQAQSINIQSVLGPCLRDKCPLWSKKHLDCLELLKIRQEVDNLDKENPVKVDKSSKKGDN